MHTSIQENNYTIGEKNNMNYEELLERAERFIESTGATVTRFCSKCGLSASLYYQWRSGKTPISAEKAAGINAFLESFGF
jgi:transcriptional regulator with XRE-family HTH domain